MASTIVPVSIGEEGLVGDEVAKVGGTGAARTRMVRCAVLALAVLVVGCSGESDAESTPTPPPVLTPTAPLGTPVPTPDQISLGSIVWTTSIDDDTGAPVDDLEVFAYDAPAIIAAIETGPLPAGTTLSAQWTMNGVAVPGAPTTVATEAERGEGWVAFELVSKEGMTWPPGELEITVTASDGASVSGSVLIQVNH